MSPVQAAEIRHDGGVFWGVQYHPEFSLREIAAILGRYGSILIDEGLFKDAVAQAGTVRDLEALHDDRGRKDLAWRYGLGREILDDDLRLTEIRNFLNHRMRPEHSRRGRG